MASDVLPEASPLRNTMFSMRHGLLATPEAMLHERQRERPAPSITTDPSASPEIVSERSTSFTSLPDSVYVPDLRRTVSPSDAASHAACMSV